jgi:low affinity Fe/Cu permease
MTREEALFKLDEAIKNKTFHYSARNEYATLCDSSEGREVFEKLLNFAKQHDRNRQERKAARAAQKAATSRGKEATA